MVSTAAKQMNIWIRADSSYSMGTGHIMRCLTLAGGLAARGGQITFICRELPGNLADYIRGRTMRWSCFRRRMIRRTPHSGFRWIGGPMPWRQCSGWRELLLQIASLLTITGLISGGKHGCRGK